MIQQLTIPQAFAFPDPKYIVLTDDVATVYTGDDIPETQTTRLIEISKFRERFTDAEKDAILDLAYNGDAIARRILLKLQTTALEIDVDHPDVIASMSYLVSVGAITDNRKDEILTP